MELLFRKHFWAVHLVFLFLVMFFIARTANLFVETAIAPSPKTSGKGVTARPLAEVPPPPLSIERLSKLTGLPLPVVEPTVTEPQQDLNAAPVRSSLRVRLLGTLLSGLKEWSIASIQDASTQKTQTYMVNDKIQGATVLDIERAKVIVLNNGRREFIDGTAGDGSGPVVTAPTPVAAAGSAPPGGNVLGEGIRAIDENNYEVPRREIDKTLSNLNDVAMQARIVPSFKDGVAQGFKLFSIRPDSIYSKIGVQNGDVIKRINGYDLNSPEKALEIYSKLKEASHIEIDIERNGSSVKKSYNVR